MYVIIHIELFIFFVLSDLFHIHIIKILEYMVSVLILNYILKYDYIENNSLITINCK